MASADFGSVVYPFDQSVEAMTIPSHTNINSVLIRPRASRVGRWLVMVIFLVWATGTIANFLIHVVIAEPESDFVTVLNRFDLGHEPSIPAYFSALLLLTSAVVLFFLARMDPEHQRRRNWAFLSLIMLILSVDEAVMFHEMGDAAMRMTPLGDWLYFAWVIPGATVALAVAIINARFLWRLPTRTGQLMVLSGAVFVGGAIGMEMVASAIFSMAEDEIAAQATLSHILSQSIEELLEMLGTGIFLFSLFDYIEASGLRIRLHYVGTGDEND